MASVSTFFLLDFFRGSHPKLQTVKTFSLHVGQGASRDDSGLMLCAATFLKESLSCTASLERIKFCGVPAEALSFLHIGPDAVPFRDRIQAEPPSLYCAVLLLESLGVLLRKQNDFGIPLRSVDMKMGCGKLTLMADHSALLAVFGRISSKRTLGWSILETASI